MGRWQIWQIGPREGGSVEAGVSAGTVEVEVGGAEVARCVEAAGCGSMSTCFWSFCPRAVLLCEGITMDRYLSPAGGLACGVWLSTTADCGTKSIRLRLMPAPKGRL